MKAVAAALVLIAGAAVVLWYGNTLNSWVLGGLIGGLAALLLSIPISLMVFSYLSKRHDERLQAEEQDEQGFIEDDYAYERVPARVMRKPREVEGYVITDETPPAAWRDEDTYAPRAYRALPAPQRTRNSERLPAVQQGTHVPAHRAPQDKMRGKETTVLRTTTKKIGGTPPFEPSSSISHHRSEALRLARLEAAQQQQDDDVEVLPNNNPKRGMIVRPTQSLAKRNNQGTSIVPPRPTTRQQPPPPARSTRQVRRVVDATGPQDGRTLPDGNDEPIRRLEPSTDSIEGSYPQTGPLRRGSQGGRSRDTTQEHEQRSGADSTHGSVNKPLVRRAPYMYDDDPLRQELAQHLEAPTVRRSSRFDEDDEND